MWVSSLLLLTLVPHAMTGTRAVLPVQLPVLHVPSVPVNLTWSDSGTTPGAYPLTAAMLTDYIALKHDLGPFFHAHQTLYTTAQAHGHQRMVTVDAGGTSGTIPVFVFDYVALAKQAPALGALFAKHQLTPAQFEPIQDAVYAADFALAGSEMTGVALDTRSVIGKNAALVRANRQALASIGINFRMQRSQ